MRTFRGYASRASAGILDDGWSQAEQEDHAAAPDGLAHPAGIQMERPPKAPGARLREALFPRLSLRALLLALLVNILLALGFAKLVEEDILRLPKPVFWIHFASPSSQAGPAADSGIAGRAGAFARGAAKPAAGTR